MKISIFGVIGGAVIGSYIFGVFFMVERLEPKHDEGSGTYSNLSELPAEAVDGRPLAIVVPVHAGDITRSFSSLTRWPAVCAQSTLQNVDLVIYHAEDLSEEEGLRHIPERASRCFRKARVVSARLSREENVYPIGPSAQFFKLFLEPSVKKQFAEYDALAIIEWDVIVAHDTSFERLYGAAFHSGEPFWMKGSTLAGTEFHETVSSQRMWHVLGHLNDNNTDPAFVEFVDYTFTRWGYFYPYDVALWATISDLPYTWTLWQRYSSKFVPTNMVSNVGFYDVSSDVVHSAFSSDTLFIHGSSKSGGRVWNIGGTNDPVALSPSSEGCEAACGTLNDQRTPFGASTVCDATCLNNNPHYESRFAGYNCGAGDPWKYGEACRLCYMDQGLAVAADKAIADADSSSPLPDVHVVMCKTLRPPETWNCSKACEDDHETICDGRCGTGRYGDLHCNWRGLGEACRFCFHDVTAARLADDVATSERGRVIMCDTHEPPRPTEPADGVGRVSGDMVSMVDETLEVDEAHAVYDDPGTTGFPGDLTQAHICAFIPGYFEFLPETNLSVSSILHFMPEMRIVIATHPMDFHVYNRTLGQVPAVAVVNASRVEFAALDADRACGEDSRLIYYMNPGQLLSRTFTRKDTHTLRGELLVRYVDVERVGKSNAHRSAAATCLLGFQAPSFTYGTDLILPVGANSDLRVLLLRRTTGEVGSREPSQGDTAEDMQVDFRKVQDLLMSAKQKHETDAVIYIPELLAALSYLKNPDGVHFTNLMQWSRETLFEEISIWDVPLVKPLFSCSADISLSLKGYDVAASLREKLQAFTHGAQCDQGVLALERQELNIKRHWEFGARESVRPMPDIREFRISVMYRSCVGDLDLFKISLPTVIDRFPDALEVVIVVEEADEEVFKRVISRHRSSAPFPLRIVTEPSLMDGHIQQKYSKMRADLYTEGDYILHLDSDVVLFERVTYDHIFHLGKPVLPFRRYRVGTLEGNELSWCWKNGTSTTIGEDVVHEFSIFNTHVYPRSMYSAFRTFIETRHGLPLVDFMSERRGRCPGPLVKPPWTSEERGSLLSDFNVMGAFLWYHMHDAVHWMATDPLDIDPEEWRRDVTKYAWVCQANGRFFPEDDAGQRQFIDNYLAVRNVAQCRIVTELWLPPAMLVPATRKHINTTTWV